MNLNKGIFYSRTPNTTAGIKLHKGLTYISVWSGVTVIIIHDGEAIGDGIGTGIVYVPVYEPITIIMAVEEYIAGLEVLERLAVLIALERSISLEVDGIAKIGNTVRLKATFYNLAGAATDPDASAVTLNIYDGNRTVVTTQPCTRESAGVYYYDYTIPAGAGPLHWEMAGKMATLPVVGRDKLEREW